MSTVQSVEAAIERPCEYHPHNHPRDPQDGWDEDCVAPAEPGSAWCYWHSDSDNRCPICEPRLQ